MKKKILLWAGRKGFDLDRLFRYIFQMKFVEIETECKMVRQSYLPGSVVGPQVFKPHLTEFLKTKTLKSPSVQVRSSSRKKSAKNIHDRQQ